MDFLDRAGAEFIERGDGHVIVSLHPTAQAAKDRGGALGMMGFSWGRFVFMSSQHESSYAKSKQFLDVLRKSLE